jgi:pyrroline-5-carboxylate reductase
MENDLRNCQIGIIGCGHLGRTLARRLVDTNFPPENLRVSYGGKPSTLDKIREADLEKNLAVNEEICSKSDLIFITIRPQNFQELKKLFYPKQAGRHRQGLIISCMASVSTTNIDIIFMNIFLR